MSLFCGLDAIAAERGDGLRPKLRRLLRTHPADLSPRVDTSGRIHEQGRSDPVPFSPAEAEPYAAVGKR